MFLHAVEELDDRHCITEQSNREEGQEQLAFQPWRVHR